MRILLDGIIVLWGVPFPKVRCTMAINVKPVALWRREIENKPGAVANVLENLRNIDLQVVMAYRYPGNPERGAVEAYPITGKKTVQAAQAAGLSASTIPALLVEGDNKAGLGYAITKALSEAGAILHRGAIAFDDV